MMIKVIKTPKNDYYYELNSKSGKYEKTTKAHGSYMISLINAELVKSEVSTKEVKTTQYYKIK